MKNLSSSTISSDSSAQYAEFIKKGFLAGKPGQSGFQDGPGEEALFNYPVNGVVSGEYLYVADSYNSVIRRVHLKTGEVGTEVGISGQRGLRDGKRGEGLLDFPEGVATDGKYLYIADTFNHAIRSYEISSGELRTLAGGKGEEGYLDGPGGEAKFNFPRGVVSIGEAVYVADTINSVIRRVEKGSGAVSTLAGKGHINGSTDGVGEQARFYFPYGLGTDGRMIYVADTLNHSIRRVDPGTGKVETIAGGGGMGWVDGTGSGARFNTPFHVTTDGRELYVADTLNHAIRAVTLATGQVKTLLNGELPSESEPPKQGKTDSLRAPRGVVYTDRFTLIVIDTDNHIIRKINLRGLK